MQNRSDTDNLFLKHKEGDSMEEILKQQEKINVLRPGTSNNWLSPSQSYNNLKTSF